MVMKSLVDFKANDLLLFANSTSEIYHDKLSIIRQLIFYKNANTYSREVAENEFFAWVTVAAKLYCKQIRGISVNWYELFTVEIRKRVQSELVEEFENEYAINKYNWLKN
jgi:hypothetical protein